MKSSSSFVVVLETHCLRDVSEDEDDVEKEAGHGR